ncbi:DUF523 domain-containing protein [Veillonella caviae]|uniref:DUF523 domain-containing protein n=1 Tax=Veillonella caviae TaxID=248316 RepID=UPI0023EFFCFC|nr:DUF523 domain-containing protein [Veillonella caviae]MCI6406610.1 DUF523 domain-containing protein [Veillonella caviae]MDY6225328.1 DUF523 domain-containing protein [Veillonella caviae]
MLDKPLLLISSCLCGVFCRYDGNHNLINNLQALERRYKLILVCPEELGGLSTPRQPAERKGNTVVTCTGEDVTDAFRYGAQQTLDIALAHRCKMALLKAKSPSCGKGQIYDGSFSKQLINGDGMATELLREHQIEVYTEEDIEDLLV